VERRLGEGISATTYLARDQALDRLVVIKSVHGHGSGDPVARTRFEREARAAASINHPNVVGVYDYGTHRGSDYLVLRYVEGETLRQHISRRHRFSAESAVRIAGQILGGLGAIHAAGLIHRDVKPDNVIVGSDGLLRITDFGIAVAATDPRLTTHGQIWGTPAYLAPEQALGRPVSAATDVYGMGIILFELLTGHVPFNGKEAGAVALAQVSSPPPSLHEMNPHTDVSPELEAVLRRALEKDPNARFQSAAAMAEALIAAAHAPALSLPVTNHSNPTMPIRAVLTETPRRAVAPSARHRRQRPRWIAVLSTILVLGAVIVWLGTDAALGFWPDGGKTPKGSIAEVVSTATERAAPLSQSAVPAATAPERATSSVTITTPAPVRATIRPSPPAAPPTPAAVIAKPTRTATAAATATPKRKKPQATATSVPEVAIELSGPTIAAVNEVVPVSRDFAASDWQGGFTGDQSWYGRPWIALYGAQSQDPQASISFTLASAPSGRTKILIDGLDDEWPGNVSVAISVNGVSIFAGASPWETWNGEGHGEHANWTTASLSIPAGTLRVGDNQIVVANTEPADNFGTGPYVLLSGASLAMTTP